MQVIVNMSYRLELTSAEFFLISKALRGELKTSDERKEATELQTRMMQSRIAYVDHLKNEMEKLKKNISSEIKS